MFNNHDFLSLSVIYRQLLYFDKSQVVLGNWVRFFFFFNLGLCCCARAFPSCCERGLLFLAVRGFLIAVASLVAEHGL